MSFTPTQALVLVGLWRRQNRIGDTCIFEDDVAVEVATTTRKTFGKVKASNTLRLLQDSGLVKSRKDGSVSLSREGERVCEALKSMGMPDFIF